MAQRNGIADLAGIDPDWARAIAQGAPPFERLRHPAFVPGAGPSGRAAAQRWFDIASAGDRGREALICDVAGLSRDEIEQAFGAFRLDGAQALPEWLDCLAITIQALPEHHDPDPSGGDSTEAAVDLFIEPAARLLDFEALQRRSATLHPQLLYFLARQLASRVLLTCGTALELELRNGNDRGWDFSRTAWKERLCGFTGLNYVAGTAIRQWRQNALEILAALERDLPAIRETLFDGRVPGRLIEIEGDLGDRHNDGRSVAVLTFETGRKVVYKPKDARSSRAFVDLVGFLRLRAPGVDLRTQRILCRGNHAWEEFIAQSQTTDPAAVRAYFRRYGMLLRLLPMVEARDFWVDNLRVAAGQPIFIDLECILHPRLPGEGFQVPMIDLDADLFEETVLPTGALTQPIVVPGFGKQDFGGLAGAGPRVLPLGMWQGYHDRRNGNIWLDAGRLYWQPDAAWPQTPAGPADPVDFLDDLRGGFILMQDVLQGEAAALVGPGGPLAALGDFPVRVLMRSTWEYLVLLRASVEPGALLDGTARETMLAHVLATPHRWGDPDDLRRRLTIAWRECEALRRLDVPAFQNLPATRALREGSRVICEDIFEGTAIARMHARIARVAEFPTAVHCGILDVGVRAIGHAPRLQEVADGAG